MVRGGSADPEHESKAVTDLVQSHHTRGMNLSRREALWLVRIYLLSDFIGWVKLWPERFGNRFCPIGLKTRAWGQERCENGDRCARNVFVHEKASKHDKRCANLLLFYIYLHRRFPCFFCSLESSWNQVFHVQKNFAHNRQFQNKYVLQAWLRNFKCYLWIIFATSLSEMARSRQLFFASVLTFANIWHTCLGEGQVESEFIFQRSAGITSITPTVGDTNGGVYAWDFRNKKLFSNCYVGYICLLFSCPLSYSHQAKSLQFLGTVSLKISWTGLLRFCSARRQNFLCAYTKEDHQFFYELVILFPICDRHNSVFMGGDATDTLSSPIARPVNFFGLYSFARVLSIFLWLAD